MKTNTKHNEEAFAVLIDAQKSIREALQQLCTTGKQILFTVKDGKLLGAVTDGDVRRYLLTDGSLDAPIAKATNLHSRFLFSAEREHAQTVIAENHFTALPIVDDDEHILDVVFRQETVDPDSVTLRELQPNDLTMVLEFFDQMAGDTRAMFNRNDVNRFGAINHLKRTKDDAQIHFAATVKNDDGSELMVGYVFLWDLDKKIPWLGIAVREDWKGHHLGRRLLQHLDDWAKPKGYGGLMLTSVSANVRAHALYERMGFKYYGVYPDSEFLYIKRYEI